MDDVAEAKVVPSASAGVDNATLPLLLPQPQAWRVAVGELDAGLFQHALDRREIVLHRGAPALFEIDDGVFGNRSPGSQFDLSHVEQTARRAAQRGRNFRNYCH